MFGKRNYTTPKSIKVNYTKANIKTMGENRDRCRQLENELRLEPYTSNNLFELVMIKTESKRLNMTVKEYLEYRQKKYSKIVGVCFILVWIILLNLIF